MESKTLLTIVVGIVVLLIKTVEPNTEDQGQFWRPCDSGPCLASEYCEPPPGGAANLKSRCVECNCNDSKKHIPQGCGLRCALKNKEVIPAEEHNKALSHLNNDIFRLKKEISDLKQFYEQSLRNISVEKDREYRELLQNELEKLSVEKKDRNNEVTKWKTVAIVSLTTLPSLIIFLIILQCKTTKICMFNEDWRRAAYRRVSYNRGARDDTASKRSCQSGSPSTVSGASSTKKLITNTENSHTNMNNREEKKSLVVSGGKEEHRNIVP